MCKENFTIPVSIDRNSRKVWNVHKKLFSLWRLPMKSFKWKFENQFFQSPWGGPQALYKTYTVEMVYFHNNKLSAQNIFSVFITTRELHNASSFNAKAIEHSVTFPRQYFRNNFTNFHRIGLIILKRFAISRSTKRSLFLLT